MVRQLATVSPSASYAAAPVALDGAVMSLHRITLLAAATLVLVGPTESVPTLRTVVPASAASPEHDVVRQHVPAMHPVGVTVPEDANEVERNAVRWAVGQFESAGLELGSVEISFSTDSADCNGEQGVYRLSSGQHSVVVCVPDLEGAAIDHRRRRTLLHELAHAWDHMTLTEADRRDLRQRFGSDDWYAPDRPWEERPVEQLAETLTWGLLGQSRRPLLIDRACDQVHADFRAVTGRGPLGPVEALCEIDEEVSRSLIAGPGGPRVQLDEHTSTTR